VRTSRSEGQEAIATTKTGRGIVAIEDWLLSLRDWSKKVKALVKAGQAGVRTSRSEGQEAIANHFGSGDVVLDFRHFLERLADPKVDVGQVSLKADLDALAALTTKTGRGIVAIEDWLLSVSAVGENLSIGRARSDSEPFWQWRCGTWFPPLPRALKADLDALAALTTKTGRGIVAIEDWLLSLRDWSKKVERHNLWDRLGQHARFG
jgi:hypothetical protein